MMFFLDGINCCPVIDKTLWTNVNNLSGKDESHLRNLRVSLYSRNMERRYSVLVSDIWICSVIEKNL